MNRIIAWARTAALLAAFSLGAVAADEPAASPAESAAQTAQPDIEALVKQFQTKMTGATLVGHFTIDSPDTDLSDLTEERYEISSVSQMPGSDLWLFNTRIVYSGKDFTVPVPLQIKWAGETPVITMEKITIPSIGTFSAHVVIYESRYAGTWQHDDVGGHLFGKVEPKADQ